MKILKAVYLKMYEKIIYMITYVETKIKVYRVQFITTEQSYDLYFVNTLFH